MARKKINRIKTTWYRNLLLVGLILIPIFAYKPLGNLVFDGITNFFTKSYLYDRYDRKWVFKPKPELTLMMIPINPAKFQRSEEVQNLIWAYCWGLFIRKYTKLTPVIVLNIPSDSKGSDMDQIRDTISTLHDQLIDLYRDPDLKKLKDIEIVFEDDNSFRKSKNIGEGTQLLVVDRHRKEHLLPLASAIELHSPTAMSFISDYTGIAKGILDQVLTEIAASLKKQSYTSSNEV